MCDCAINTFPSQKEEAYERHFSQPNTPSDLRCIKNLATQYYHLNNALQRFIAKTGANKTVYCIHEEQKQCPKCQNVHQFCCNLTQTNYIKTSNTCTPAPAEHVQQAKEDIRVAQLTRVRNLQQVAKTVPSQWHPKSQIQCLAFWISGEMFELIKTSK